MWANVGGGYNPNSSAFTAPIPGLYFFIVHVDCSNDYRSIFAYVNNSVKFHADNDHQDGHVTGSGLLPLKAGDVVTVRHMTDAGTVDAGPESTFTGFLVK